MSRAVDEMVRAPVEVRLDPEPRGDTSPLAMSVPAVVADATSAGEAAPAGSPTSAFLASIRHEYARRHLILSEGERDGDELLLVAASTRATAVFNTGVRLKRPVRTRVLDAERLASMIDSAYSRSASGSAAETVLPVDHHEVMIEGASDVESALASAVATADRDLLNTEGKAPSVRLVDLILFEALQRSASDVHVQPLCDRTLVRYRLDGALRTVRELPASLAASVVSRVKVMARLDIAERRTPQDGRATVTIGAGSGSSTQRRVDLRISTLPSTYGERLVIRLLDPTRSAYLTSFDGLGMPEPIKKSFLSQVSRTNGIVLSTGPTGSGKTTTLYTTLAWISSTNAGGARARATGCELNMMTIEDPVEYDLSTAGLSISQTQVDPKKNVTFATGLRHVLRQDPDVIMVGEIRDEETAKIAVQASLTGHLVLSTLHTNDAPSAVVRLVDLGVEPFLVGSSLSAVLAQRLVRRVRADCAGAGCEACLHSGFKGRMGVFELLVLNSELRELVSKRVGAAELKMAAVRAGLVPLREAGAALVRAGITSSSEVARVIEALDEVVE
jgi:general secretion pathway protein E